METKSTKRAERRAKREAKAMRRLSGDRNEHAWDLACPCSPNWGEYARWRCVTAVEEWRAYRKTFARMADTPKACNGFCCANPRHWGLGDALTLQERRFTVRGRDIELAPDFGESAPD